MSETRTVCIGPDADFGSSSIDTRGEVTLAALDSEGFTVVEIAPEAVSGVIEALQRLLASKKNPRGAVCIS